jgi:protein SCO1/2
MDPEGKFVEAFGQSVSKEEIIEKVGQVLGEWQQGYK